MLGPILAEPVVAGGRVYVGCKDGYLYGVPTDYDSPQAASVQKLSLRTSGFWPWPPKWDPSGLSPAVDGNGDVYAAGVVFSWSLSKLGFFTVVRAFKQNGDPKSKFPVMLGRAQPVGSPVLFDGLVYVACTDGSVFRVNSQLGTLVTPTPKLQNATITSSPAVTPGPFGPIVFVGTSDKSGGEMGRLQATDGQRFWKTDPLQTPMGDGVFSSPSVVGGRIYVGCIGPLVDRSDPGGPHSGHVYAFNVSDMPPQGGTLTPGWDRKLSDHEVTSSSAVTLSTPAHPEGVVYIGSDDYKLHALDATDGTPLWQSPTTDKVRSCPTVAAHPDGQDGIVYVGSNDHHLYAFNADTGDALGPPLDLGQEVHSSAAVVDGTVYIASGIWGGATGKLYAFH